MTEIKHPARELSDERMDMARLYAETGNRLAELKWKKATYILAKRASGDSKSYADAERMFDVTEEGKELLQKDYLFKGYDKLLSAIKTKIEVEFKGY